MTEIISLRFDAFAALRGSVASFLAMTVLTNILRHAELVFSIPFLLRGGGIADQVRNDGINLCLLSFPFV